MNCPKCDGETREATDVDSGRDEVIELGWFYCQNPECQWTDYPGSSQESRPEDYL